jgi:metal-dependent amidase/aminoacylase/carboxypeptidase family protein
MVSDLRKKIEMTGAIKIGQGQRSFAGEDFCEFSDRVPSCYVAVGSALPESIDLGTGESMFPAHSPRHKLDEVALLWALKIWLLIIFG